MELVTHTCGARLWRVEAGGVAHTVHYSDGQHEIHECPRCGEILSDSTLTGEHGRPIRAEKEG